MASISFPISNHLITTKSRSLRHHQFRFIAGCAAVERTPRDALQAPSFYQVLGIGTGATCLEIKSAYRKLARVLHPDGRGGAASAADDFVRLQAAYATLSDPEKRAVYDRSLLRLRRTAASGCPELTRRGRTWETDQCW